MSTHEGYMVPYLTHSQCYNSSELNREKGYGEVYGQVYGGGGADLYKGGAYPLLSCCTDTPVFDISNSLLRCGISQRTYSSSTSFQVPDHFLCDLDSTNYNLDFVHFESTGVAADEPNPFSFVPQLLSRAYSNHKLVEVEV